MGKSFDAETVLENIKVSCSHSMIFLTKMLREKVFCNSYCICP